MAKNCSIHLSMDNLLVSRSLLVSLILFAEQRGVSSSTIAHFLGINDLDPGSGGQDEMVPLVHLAKLYEFLEQKTGDKNIGLHVGELYNVAAMGLVGQLIQNSRTVGEALQKGCDFFNLVTNGFEMIIENENQHFKLIFNVNSTLKSQFPSGSKHIMVASMAYAVKEIYYLIGKSIKPDAIVLNFELENTNEYERILGAVPVRSENEVFLKFENSILEQPIIYSDYEMLLTLEQVACDRVKRQQMSSPEFSQKVNTIIYSLIDPTFPSIEDVASNLHMTPRTIQRKLKNEDTTFGSLLENIKKELAVTYLKKDLTIKEVSYLMGYTESSSFVTAFKKWFGKTPVKFRSFL